MLYHQLTPFHPPYPHPHQDNWVGELQKTENEEKKNLMNILLSEHNLLHFISQVSAWSESKVTTADLTEPAEVLIVAQL